MVLPVREIGDVIFADFFRQIFAGVRVRALPFFQRREIRQRDEKKFAPLYSNQRIISSVRLISEFLGEKILAFYEVP